MTPRLIIVSGPESGLTIYLDKPVILIGRHPANRVSLDDPEASRQHCLIKREDERFVIKDLDSTNGTYLNARRITESALTEGSLIQIGSTLVLFWLHEFDELLSLKPTAAESQHGCAPSERIGEAPSIS